jgi:hypothetical protein
MPNQTHQTVKLARGKHVSPDSGACVLELASMLAGEPFSDHPECVCPVIGGFLRAYNDSIDNTSRQDLYAYAAKVVASRASAEVEAARAKRLVEWTRQRRSTSWRRIIVPELLRRLAAPLLPSKDVVGPVAVHAVRRHTAESHAAALALIDELLAMRETDGPVEATVAHEQELETATK